MPTTGPFTRSIIIPWGNGKMKSFRRQWWYRNGPGPYVPHPYELQGGVAQTSDADAGNDDAGYYAWGGVNSPPTEWYGVSADIHNKCYAKFVAKVREQSAQLGPSAAEWQQSEKMIRQRGGQLLRAARQLKRGYPFEFFRELGMLHRRPRGLPNRSDPKKAANLWLEYHFGWEPLVKDIYSAVDVLQAPLPVKHKVMVRKTSEWMELKWDQNDYPYSTLVRRLRGKFREQMIARIEVTNPNLYTATSLGLTNPASILWEIVPFSFVVDWFIPVGSFLSSFTDFLGVAVTEQSQTKSWRYTSHYQLTNIWPPWYPPVVQPPRDNVGWCVSRTTTITGPTLTLRPLKVPSVSRAATAISLLIQQLSRLP